MALKVTHELHQRRFGRNIGLGILLVLFVALVYGLTFVKVRRGEPMEGYDHVVQPQAVPAQAPVNGAGP